MGTYFGQLKVDNGDVAPIGSTLYGTCDTAAATAAKVAVVTGFNKLITGVTVHIKFTNSNTVANPTLAIKPSSSGTATTAKSIMKYGTTAPSTSAATSWQAGSVISLTYDGTYWQMNDHLDDTNTQTVTGVKGNSESTYRTGNVNITATNIGLGNVGNFKAVSTVASQGLTDTEKSNARTNIGAGTSNLTIGTSSSTAMAGNTNVNNVSQTNMNATTDSHFYPILCSDNTGSSNINSGANKSSRVLIDSRILGIRVMTDENNFITINSSSGTILGNSVRVDGKGGYVYMYADDSLGDLYMSSMTGSLSSNLNAKLNASCVSQSATANTVVRRDKNGYIYAVYYNTTCPQQTPSTSDSAAYIDGNGWLRKSTMANMRNALSLGSAATKNVASGNGAATNYYDRVCYISGNPGIVEMGQYIDFHVPNSNVDYSTRIYANSSGGLSCSGAFSPGSSRKIKKNIEPISQEEADKILLLEPVKFDYKLSEKNDQAETGFIAEDVYEILPKLTVPEEGDESEHKTWNPMGLKYEEIIPYLVKVCQRQQNEIDDLKTQIEELRNLIVQK